MNKINKRIQTDRQKQCRLISLLFLYVFVYVFVVYLILLIIPHYYFLLQWERRERSDGGRREREISPGVGAVPSFVFSTVSFTVQREKRDQREK